VPTGHATRRHYVTVNSIYDELVGPIGGELPPAPNVTNVILQNICPLDFGDHLSMVADPMAVQYMLNALDPAHAKPIQCALTLPVI
jgi:triacylglycerol lipase